MNTDQLSYFLSIADTGSVNASAQNFFISQQAMNLQIKKLESDLHVKLFNRTPKGFTLTLEGKAFQKYAEKILLEYHSAISELNSISKNKKITGTLTLFASSIFADCLLVNIVHSFTTIYPNAEIKIVEVDIEHLPSYLNEQYCDLALLSSNLYYAENVISGKTKEDIKMLPLLDDDVAVCVRKDHPLAKAKTIDTAFLSAHFPKQKYSFYQILPQRGREVKDEKSLSNSSNVELHKNFVLSGISAIIMPFLAYQYKFQNELLTVIRLKDADTLIHCLFYHDNPNKENYLLLQTFIQHLYDCFSYTFGARIIGKRP